MKAQALELVWRKLGAISRRRKARIGMWKSSGVILLMQRLCARQNRSTPTAGKAR